MNLANRGRRVGRHAARMPRQGSAVDQIAMGVEAPFGLLEMGWKLGGRGGEGKGEERGRKGRREGEKGEEKRGRTSNIEIEIRKLLRDNHQPDQRKNTRQTPQQKNRHKPYPLPNSQLQPHHRRQRQQQDREISHHVNSTPHNKKLQRVDTASPRDGLVPDVGNGPALEGADQDHHDRPADGQQAEAVGGQPEVALAAEDPDI